MGMVAIGASLLGHCLFGVVDAGMGMVARWVDVEANVEVMTMRDSMDKYWFATSCEASEVGVPI